jgi:cytidyltransferase-like protein
MKKKVFCAGSFDLLTSGHITFLQEAAKYGNLYVGIGNDESILKFKGRKPVCPEAERLFMVKALACVEDCWINSGQGQMDWINEVVELMPDILIVNEDQDTTAKWIFCQKHGIEYIVLKRKQLPGLPARSTTELRKLL